MKLPMMIITLAIIASAPVSAFAACSPITNPSSCIGPQGNDGPAGPAGTNGIDGVNGTNGTNGLDGAVGAKGDKGDQGIAGTNGTNGTNGLDGKDGKDGLNFNNADLQRGLATVAALDVPHIDVGKKFGVSATTGLYGNHPAIGLGIGLRFNENWQVGGSLATDTDSKNVAGKVTASAQW
jgi:hypothetical protein